MSTGVRGHRPQQLAVDECWKVLCRLELARLAYHDGARVQLAPINYAVEDGRLIFRTGEGSKLAGVLQNPDVAIEVDETVGEVARSVVARGVARELDGLEALMTDQLRLRPWVDSVKDHVIAIELTSVSGRVFALTRPWRHIVSA